MLKSTQEIRIKILEYEEGLALIAFTSNGLYCLDLGQDKGKLLNYFKQQHPSNSIKELNSQELEHCDNVLTHLNHPSNSIKIDLDLQGTPFQKEVWKSLMTIPSGETRTYSEVAIEMGKPKSVRAIANACGQNKIAVIIPCHRVIRKDGSLSGYKWGIERKAKLLELETLNNQFTL